MIDVKNYEGHIQGEWRDTIHEGALAHHIYAGDTLICTVQPNEATANLVTDAPKLLAKCKSLAGQLVATRAYLNDLVTFIKEQDLLEFCSKCDAFYTFDDGRQCNCCPSCVGEDYDADDNRTCRDCKIEFSERFYE
jgi:hypothetical protein